MQSHLLYGGIGVSTNPTAGYLVANVRVVLNDERDSNGHWSSITRGYVAETANLRCVFSLRVAERMEAEENLGATLLRICEHVFLITNQDPEAISGPERAEAEAYRAKHVRSVSVGDVVIIDLPDRSYAFAVASFGHQPIAVPALS